MPPKRGTKQTPQPKATKVLRGRPLKVNLKNPKTLQKPKAITKNNNVNKIAKSKKKLSVEKAKEPDKMKINKTVVNKKKEPMNEKQVNEKVFPCSECKENFPTSVLLKRHQVSCSKKKAEVSPKKRASPSDDVEEIVVKKKKIEEPVYDVEEGSDVDESSDVVVPNEKGNKKGILQAFMSSKVQSLLSSANAKSIQKDNSSAEKQDLTDKSAEKDKVSICASSLRKNIALSLQKNKSSESKSRNRKSDHCEASQPAVPVTSSLSEKDDDLDSSNSVQKKKRGRPSRRQPEEQNQSSDISANKQSKTEDPKSNALATTEKSSKQIEKQRKNEQLVKPSKKVNEEKTTENNADTVVKVHEEKQASKSAAKVVSKGRRGRRPLRKKDDKPNSVKSTSAKSSNDISQASSQDVEIDVPTSDANEIAVVDKQVNSKQASKSVDPSSGHNGPNIHFDESRNDIDDPPVVTNGSSDAANGSVEILTQSETTTSNNEDARAFMVDLLTDYSSLDATAPAIKAEKPDPSEDPGALDRLPNQTIFTCAVCHKNFTRKFHLDRHLRISRCSGLPMPSFPCELCNRVYTRKDNLREHLRSHTGEVQRRKNHKCQFCDKAFHGQSLLAIHIRKHTGEKPFECDFCPKKFPSAGALSKHRLTHTGERPYSCNECGRRFALKGTLSRHLRTHTGIRPHSCSFCGKKFIQIGGLNAHMFYHTGENGFRCEDCGKIFNRKARLQMHQLYVHIKLKPFVCSHCNKTFTRKEDLMRHTVSHTGEKPFKCPTCDRRFSVKPSLKLHLLTHTKEEPRSCHECGRAFIRKDCLLRHMRRRHRDVFDKILFDEKDEKDASIVNSRVLSEKDLTDNIRELLYLLIDEPTLVGFGWPNKAVDEVLELVIQRCGHTPVSRDNYSYEDRLRENAKLLFTVVIDDNAVKTLLNNQTVDEVILHVLRLAKT